MLGALVMRVAGCVINDYADRDFDPHVERTRQRPIAAWAGLFIYQQELIRHRDKPTCFRAFLNNQWFGAVIFAGIGWITCWLEE